MKKILHDHFNPYIYSFVNCFPVHLETFLEFMMMPLASNVLSIAAA